MLGTLHALEHWLLQYRRVWYGSVFSSFVTPVLFLISIGYGVGSYVGDNAALGGVDYATFVAPGLLASVAVQTAAGDMTWPVFAALKWGNQYKAMQASPLTPRQMLSGHLLYALLRVMVNACVFCVVMACFGIFSATAPLSIVVTVAVGFAFIGWIYAYTITVKSETALSIIQRFGIVPVTLFSGVFFPLTQLPVYVQPFAWISPLWHGAELSRWAVSGTPPMWPWLAHVVFLLAVGTLGWWVAGKRLRRRITF